MTAIIIRPITSWNSNAMDMLPLAISVRSMIARCFVRRWMMKTQAADAATIASIHISVDWNQSWSVPRSSISCSALSAIASTEKPKRSKLRRKSGFPGRKSQIRLKAISPTGRLT